MEGRKHGLKRFPITVVRQLDCAFTYYCSMLSSIYIYNMDRGDRGVDFR